MKLYTATDVSKARKILLYQPQVSLKDGLAREWDWIQSLAKKAECDRESKAFILQL
ncbi:hypothetical protein H6G17_09580 [Chroococcidiopsis sp. FACHB-1243]|uniref:hypothetical protein n=1 Tax=Chroococcidiopsis sp. [FACHB-1243] TaxID=2692781 RepID=UPI00177F663A|nr:hypothetical protein [Chroococcidiopsis sp. [FACHB-1243]]MBD2305760.1 hypothetical protein [Chroococcidiopsis sp. [FACHB-1243]]